MHKLQAMSLRRKTINWRDKWVSLVPERLERNLRHLFELIDSEIDQMGRWKLIVNSGRYVQSELQPIYQRWATDQTLILLEDAQAELRAINDKILNSNKSSEQILRSKIMPDELLASAIAPTATVTGGVGGVVGIASLTTIKTGGFLSIGASAIIGWPLAILGMIVIIFFGFIFRWKWGTFRERARKRLKVKIRERIRNQVLSHTSQDTVSSCIQEKIKLMCHTYLEDLKNAK